MNNYSLPKIFEIYKKNKIVSTDTRNLPKGCLFFALKGDRFDGNAYAEKAIEEGAIYSIIDDASVFDKSSKQENLILVTDVLQTLQQLARMYRDSLHIPVIGVGGSNGKTTTKELLNAILSKKFRTHATRGNLNNHIGVPLTILSIPADTEMAVIELGTNQPGDIAQLVEIANPDFGLITNIGKEHLEGFGSLENVAREEQELYYQLKKVSGLSFVNADDDMLTQMAEELPRVITYGFRKDASVQANLTGTQPGVQFETESGMLVNSNLPGSFNLSNILAAWAVGRHFGVEEWMMKEAVEGYIPQNNRSQVLEKNGLTFFLDCYNANPSSMEAALQSFSEMKATKKIAILGDMLELGTYAEAEHKNILEILPKLGIKDVFLVGPIFHKVNTNYPSFFTSEELAAHFRAEGIADGTLLFLKGSRGIAVEKSVEEFMGR